MAKKTVKLNEPVRDAEPFDHGVRITYKDAVIAQSADDAEYDLLTANTIVEENINVQLVNIVPPVLVPFKLINNTEDELVLTLASEPVRVMNGGVVYPISVDYFADGNYILPNELKESNAFYWYILITAPTDQYEVLMNSVPVSYSNDEQQYNAELTITQFTAATHLTITVNDKPANGK